MTVNPAIVQAEPFSMRVNGLAAPQGSKTLTRWGGMKEASANVLPWREAIKAAVQTQYNGIMMTGPVEVIVEFIFQRPKGHYKTKNGVVSEQLKDWAPIHCESSRHGDIDKLCRSTLDGLAAKSGGQLIADDSQVVMLTARKRYANVQEPAGAMIAVKPL